MSIGDGAFTGCQSLITEENGLQYVDGWVIDCTVEVTSADLSNVKGIAAATFANCINLESVVIPKNVTNIDIKVFAGCTSLTNVYYMGTEQEWMAVTIGEGNDVLSEIDITYNYVPEQ